ncbi:hypothetical protein LguiB_005217 [Lonicera macranthoides]
MMEMRHSRLRPSQQSMDSFMSITTLCNSIFLSYTHTAGTQLLPNLTDPTTLPYRFKPTLTILSNGLDKLKSFQVLVGFQHYESSAQPSRLRFCWVS